MALKSCSPTSSAFGSTPFGARRLFRRWTITPGPCTGVSPASSSARASRASSSWCAASGAEPSSAIAGASWRDYGAVVAVADWDEAVAITDRIAPEHLEICTADPETLAARVTHAGAIFIGALTPEVVGDYVGGPNHVLPTARSARFSSGLSVFDFLKRTTILGLGPEQLRALAGPAIALAEAEGLDAHARSVAIRLNR